MIDTLSTEQPAKIVEDVDNDTKIEEDRIAKLFAGKILLITGATGFIGKVLIEKLLRLCPDIDKIYVLIREKKGKNIQERFEETMNNEIFNLAKRKRGDNVILKKIVPIHGDLLLPDLGISEENRKLLAEEVNIVYHCAGTVRFDEEIQKAILINTKGTKLMLNLIKEFKQLKYFAYVSTTYCHLNVPHLLEKPYDPPADPEEMIRLSDAIENSTMNFLEKKLLGDVPNTYAFTKSLAEDLVAKSFNELPTFIHRLSIAMPIWKEPIRGWTDSINGPMGLLVAAGRGVLRSMYLKSDVYGDFLPVDIAVNMMLISTWHTLHTNDLTQRVTHMTSSNEIKVSWKKMISVGQEIIENKIPLNGIAWYPGGGTTSSLLYHKFCLYFFMWLPSVLGDCLIRCATFPPILCRIQHRLRKGLKVLEYFGNRNWSFDNSGIIKFRKALNNTERLKYVIEKIDIDITKYLEDCILSTRRYVLKSPDSLIIVAKRNMRIMWCFDKLIKYGFLLWFMYFVYCKFIFPEAK